MLIEDIEFSSLTQQVAPRATIVKAQVQGGRTCVSTAKEIGA